MIEAAIVFGFLCFCAGAKVSSILCVVFFLLPIHGSIKSIVFHGGGEIFAIWKELGILVILLKTLKNKNPYYRNLFGITSLFFVYCLIFLGIGVSEGFSVSATVKKIFFPILLLFAVSKSSLSETDVKKILFCCLLGSVLVNITAVLDFISPSMRMMFRDIMRIGYKVSSSGDVYYDVSSFKIMGIDRACGLMAGGPNQLGVFNSGVVTAGGILFLFFRESLKKKRMKILFILSFSLSFFCLLISFSRAGWALVLLLGVLLGVMSSRYRKKTIVIVFVAAFFSILAYLTIPTLQMVVDGTISGNESSSAARAGMTQNSVSFLLEHPMGFGFGASNHSVKNFVAFAESSIVNFGYEIGVAGVLLLLYLVLRVARAIKRNMRFNCVAIIAYPFVFSYLITSCVSVNPFENPYVYYAWLFMGLALICPLKNVAR